MFREPANFIVLLACIGVAAILAWGLGTFGTGDTKTHGKKSNQIMRYRIYAQGVAVVLIAGIVYLRKFF